MKTTYLYVKQSPLGLLYLGKTEQNPYNYKGSGKIWKRHLKKHNISTKEINTFILHITECKEDLKNMGEYYSKILNVVGSAGWANMKSEIGDGGTSKGHLKGIKKPQHSEKMKGKSNPRYNKKASQETREKIRAAHKGKRRGEDSFMAKKVDQYDKNGNFLKKWGSIIDIERELGVAHQHISKVCKGERKSAGGFVWKYC